MKLYTYFRSSAAYRVRIALNFKGVPYESAAVNLLKGEQREDAYGAINPQKRIPSLDIGGTRLIQSPAILEYLDEVYPEPPLLPVGAVNRAKVRAIASVVGCLFYFATLTEIPILQALMERGMNQGPALALLLAGPALSLPSLLVIRSVIGNTKTLVFTLLTVLMATIVGITYGMFVIT